MQSKALKKTRLGILRTAAGYGVGHVSFDVKSGTLQLACQRKHWWVTGVCWCTFRFQWRMLLCLESGGIWWNFKTKKQVPIPWRMETSWKRWRFFHMLSGSKGTVLPSQKSLGTTYTSSVPLAPFWAPQPLPPMVDPVENDALVPVAAPGTGAWSAFGHVGTHPSSLLVRPQTLHIVGAATPHDGMTCFYRKIVG